VTENFKPFQRDSIDWWTWNWSSTNSNQNR